MKEENSKAEEKKFSINASVRLYLMLPTHRKIELWRKLGYEAAIDLDITGFDNDKMFFNWVTHYEKRDTFCETLYDMLNSDKEVQGSVATAAPSSEEPLVQKNPLEDITECIKYLVIEAARYGFNYHTTSQHHGEVPTGNILQWLNWYLTEKKITLPAPAVGGMIDLDAARKLRGFFGKNDASHFEHWAYAYFDRIVKQLETASPAVKDDVTNSKGDDWKEIKRKNKYQFLYWLNEDFALDPRAKYITANNIEDACKKFLDKKPESLTRVDYEVEFNGTYIDISDVKGFENYI